MSVDEATEVLSRNSLYVTIQIKAINYFFSVVLFHQEAVGAILLVLPFESLDKIIVIAHSNESGTFKTYFLLFWTTTFGVHFISMVFKALL